MRLASTRDSLRAALALTAVWHGPSLWRGFHRWDDFAFLQMADRTTLAQNVWTPHNDHLLPLWRVQVESLYGLFGLSTAPWILVSLICFALLLLALERFLADRGVSAAGRWMTLILASSWAAWAEVASGYYTLTVYLQIGTLFFLALAAERRARATGRRRFVGALIACILVAAGLDVSGLWVGVAVPVIALADADWRRVSWRPSLRAYARTVSVCGASVLFAGTVMIGAGWRWNPALVVVGADQSVPLLDRLLVLLAALASILLAPWRAVGYALPGSVALPVLNGVLLLATLLVLGWRLRGVTDAQRNIAVALLVVIALHATMLAIGRPFLPAEFPAKHVGIPFLLFSAMVGVLWPTGDGAMRPAARLLLGSAICLIVGAQYAANVFAARRGYPVTAKVELWLAGERQRALGVLRDSLIVPLVRSGVTTIPTAPAFLVERAAKDMRFYDLSVYRPFFDLSDPRVRFARDPEMEASVVEPGLTVVEDLRTVTGHQMHEFFLDHPWARQFWLGDMPMRATPGACRHPTSTSLAELPPDSAWRILAGLDRARGVERLNWQEGSARAVSLELELETEWGTQRHVVVLPRHEQACVALRQLPAWVLADSIFGLRVRRLP